MIDPFLSELVARMPDGGWPKGKLILNAHDAAALLGIQPTTLRDWVARGHITRVARNRYDMGEVVNYLASRS